MTLPPPLANPTIPGIYSCKWRFKPHPGDTYHFFNYFDGSHWRVGGKDPATALLSRAVASDYWTLLSWEPVK